MIHLKYNDEYYEYHGAISLGGRDVTIHFPLSKPSTEPELLAKHELVLSQLVSRYEWLIEQAVKLNQPHGELPDLNAVIIDEGGTFDLQFGSSARRDKLWCEVMYESSGNAYQFERHPPNGDAA